MNVYVVPGELCLRLTRLTRNDILTGKGPRIHCSFRRRQQKFSVADTTAVKKRKQPAPAVAGPSRLSLPQEIPPAKKKRPYEYVEASEEDEDEIDGSVDDFDNGEEDFTNAIRAIDEALPSDAESSEDGEGGGDWEYSLRPSIGTSKKRKVSLPVKGPSKQVNKRNLDEDVISLSSD